MMYDSASTRTIELKLLNERIVNCRRCPRLVEWRERVATVRRKSYLDEDYWGKPVPNFGDPSAEHLIVGLAPAAHGGNRTGRIFTGDRSGDWLFRALHAVGSANQPTSTSASDGLQLRGVMITAVAHCAPPDNKPTVEEIGNCSDYFIELLRSRHWKAILCLGSIAWIQVHRCLKVSPVPKFGHGVESAWTRDCAIIASYHPSQQNTFTGRLTEQMLESVMRRFLSP